MNSQLEDHREEIVDMYTGGIGLTEIRNRLREHDVRVEPFMIGLYLMDECGVKLKNESHIFRYKERFQENMSSLEDKEKVG